MICPAETARCRHAVLALLALGLPLLLASRSHAQSTPEALEHAIEATFVLKFPSFVTWHDPLPPNSFNICVVGDTPIAPLLREAAAGQRVEHRQVSVRELASASAGSLCQEAFVAGSDAQSVAAALAALRGSPILTITNGQTDPAAKGIVNFVLAGGHVRFQIDLTAAAANDLSISSKLLSIAIGVHGSAH